MTKSKFLIIIIVVLLLTNLATVFMRPPPPHQGPKGIIIEKLAFDESQVKKYEALIDLHSSKIQALDKSIRNTKNKLYSTISSADEGQKKEVLSKLGKLHSDIENLHYNHFKDIKAICTKAQLPKFDALANELAKLFAPKPHRPHP